MKRSTDRILTTHVGSLVRPMSIRNTLIARDYGQPYDEAAYQKTLRDEVANVVREQATVGIDIVSDGEYGKAGWIRYVAERLGGFIHREVRPGEGHHDPTRLIREAKQFAEFYAAYSAVQFYDWLPPDQSKGLRANEQVRKNLLVWECTGPISYAGQQAVRTDVDNLSAALKQVKVEGGFMPVAAPMSARGLWLNSYYKTDSEIVVALADALKEEYKAIVEGGFTLQLDDAFLAHEYDRLAGEEGEREARKYAERCIELTNYALTGIPADKVRYHVCWGSWNAPHTTDVPMKILADFFLKVKAQAFSLEGANPRHEHEWMVWKNRKFPDGKILLPGVVTHSTNVVEHPELVAWRIKNYASVVGRENVIASTDCGFSQSYNIVRCHPSVQWAKLESLVAGARLASKELWAKKAPAKRRSASSDKRRATASRSAPKKRKAVAKRPAARARRRR
jgi:5-methyltetrahydropteroyltriglutamate--homocysteine methyltransferase